MCQKPSLLGNSFSKTPCVLGLLPSNLSALPPTSALLAREFATWVADAVMPSECVRPAERLYVGAEMTPVLSLACIVNCILVACKIVGPREDGVARIPGAWVNTVAQVWSCLAIQDKCLGGVLSQGLLTSAAAGGGLGRSASIVGTRVGL